MTPLELHLFAWSRRQFSVVHLRRTAPMCNAVARVRIFREMLKGDICPTTGMRHCRILGNCCTPYYASESTTAYTVVFDPFALPNETCMCPRVKGGDLQIRTEQSPFVLQDCLPLEGLTRSLLSSHLRRAVAFPAKAGSESTLSSKAP